MTTAPHPIEPTEQSCSGHRLLLFVAGNEPNSRMAKENVARLLKLLPEQQVPLETIDVLEDFRPALEHKILVTPCLLLLGPNPPVRVAGNLSDMEHVRAALNLSND